MAVFAIIGRAFALFHDDLQRLERGGEVGHLHQARQRRDLGADLSVGIAEDAGIGLIGPSYFMKPGLDKAALAQIWKYRIEPLIADIFFTLVRRFTTSKGIRS